MYCGFDLIAKQADLNERWKALVAEIEKTIPVEQRAAEQADLTCFGMTVRDEKGRRVEPALWRAMTL